MSPLDWTVVFLYMIGVVAMSLYVGASQVSQEDYYLGSRRIGPWAIAMSILATQCSSISLIGAPAFIALKPGGGLIWLQYEFALPLAMIFLILFIIPVFHGAALTTIYEYLERRFGRQTRALVCNIFLLGRGLATGVSLYATAVVLAVVLNLSITTTLLLVGGVSIAYTTIGGIKADIYSDVVQLIVLWLGALVCIISLVGLMGGWSASINAVPLDRSRIIDWNHHGLGDNGTYSFWCMLFGGLFLYLSYYGCDQTQTQRLLASRTLPLAQKALFLNGILRFPLVFTYCLFGLLLSGWVTSNPEVLGMVPGEDPDFLVPVFVTQYVPMGLKGLIVAGLLAASMSSLDSSLNSLSAVTLRDLFPLIRGGANPDDLPQGLRTARLLTLFWGVICTALGLAFSYSTSTVIELVNMVGSLFYGPVLGLFLLGILSHRGAQRGAIAGLLGGMIFNVCLWLSCPGVSWLWWNPLGCLVTCSLGYVLSLTLPGTESEQLDLLRPLQDLSYKTVKPSLIFAQQRWPILSLVGFFFAIILFCLWLEDSMGI